MDQITPAQALYTVPEVVKILRLSRSEIYEQMAANRLAFVKVGRSRRVTPRAVAAFVALLEQEAGVAA